MTWSDGSGLITHDRKLDFVANTKRANFTV